MADRLQAQIAETEKRFRDREKERASVEHHLERGGLAEANSDDAIRRRLSHLGVPPQLKDKASKRSFRATAELTPASDARAVVQAELLERVLGQNDLMPISYLLLGQHRARSIGRIHIRDQHGRGIGFGTGFLVSPRLLLTNNHVLEDARTASFSEIEFDFEVDLAGNVRQTVRFPLKPASFFLTDRSLDFSLVAVAPNADADREPRDWGWNRLPEEDGLIVKGEYVSIIQHPNGEAKQIALRENQVIDLLDDFAHYQTDTAPGSSGSPVFNDQWEVVALHHSGVPKRDGNGNILAVDGRKWEEWMGDHRINWIANEGVSGSRIVTFVKNASLSGEQKRLRDEILQTEPPRPEGIVLPDSRSKISLQEKPSTAMPSLSNTPPSPAESGATWTIPLQITVNLGQAALAAPGNQVAPLVPSPKSEEPTGTAEDAELQQALAEIEAARTRIYYDVDADAADREAYYSGFDPDELSPKAMFQTLSELLTSTHTTKPAYKPSLHVYPWVDLHPDRKLRSIYSGKTFDAEELIREDFRIERDRKKVMRELLQRESAFGPEQLRDEIDLLESQHPFNCEHVVPQSWFSKKEPMRGDLHHLFACESGCNSFRGNIPYFDFSDFEEAVRTECGRRDGKRFEPSAGKGAVARATLYFLLRYPGQINDIEGELQSVRLQTLLNWHADDPVNQYERHRNQAIFKKQGNRNPLVDHPEWAGDIRFTLGLG